MTSKYELYSSIYNFQIEDRCESITKHYSSRLKNTVKFDHITSSKIPSLESRSTGITGNNVIPRNTPHRSIHNSLIPSNAKQALSGEITETQVLARISLKSFSSKNAFNFEKFYY